MTATQIKSINSTGSATPVYKNSGVEVVRRDCQGLRFQTVKHGNVVDTNLIIDQHGRIFTNDRNLEYIACGYASH